MATLEKLVRTVEALKLHQAPSVSLDETMTKKDKISHCVSVTETLCNQSIKNTSEAAKYLTMAMEMYFTLLDDSDSDIRMVADESLNKVIRAQGEGNVTKIQVELFKEIKKNGGSRSVRAALWRFAHLATSIKPSKCRTYLVNLLPCLEALVKRTEESVHETLAYSLPLLFKVFGNFTNDNELKLLMAPFLVNLGSSSGVLRRTASSSLVVLVSHCTRSHVAASWLLNTASHMLLPLGSEVSSYLIMGTLQVCRSVLPYVQGDTEAGCFIKLYEICIYFLNSQDHNIVNATLETLLCLLKVESKLFLYLINSPGGLMSSSVTEMNSESRDLSKASRELEESQLSQLPTDVSVQSLCDIASSKPVLSITQSVDDDSPPSLESVPAEDKETVSDQKLTQSKSELDFDGIKEETLFIGKITGEGISLHYVARLISSKFLLTQEKGTTVPDSIARVSVKSLAMSCLSEIIYHNPQVWNLPLSANISDFSVTTVIMSDLTLYLEHEDPGITGILARLISNVLRGACVESCGEISKWFEGKEDNHSVLVDMLISSLNNDSSQTAKQTLTGLRSLLPKMVESDCCVETRNLLSALLKSTQNNYWLVKVEAADIIVSLDPLACSYVFKDWIDQAVATLTDLLSSEDIRVRSAAAEALTKLANISVIETQNLAFEKSKLIYHKLNEDVSVEDAYQPPHSESLPKADLAETRFVYHLVIKIFNMLRTAGKKELFFGCIQVLHKLSVQHSPVKYPGAWGIHMHRVRKYGINEESMVESPAISILSTIINLLQSCIPCLDMTLHSALLTLATNLFAGLACYNLRETNDVSKESIDCLVYDNVLLSRLGENLMTHTVKLLAICQHVIEDAQPAQSSKPTIPSLQTTNLSPIKKKAPDSIPPSSQIPPLDKQTSKEDRKGIFSSSTFYMRMYDNLKSSYNVYKTSLDFKSEERIHNFVSDVLLGLSEMMKYVVGYDVSKYIEEYLTYMKACMGLAPGAVLICVQSALKCLFKINLPFIPNTYFPSYPRIQTSPSIFEVIISSPYTSFTLEHGLNLEAKDYSSSLSSNIGLTMIRSNPFKVARSITDKVSLSSYIRLFEPVVIKALKHYTVTCHVTTQVEVLSLLIQLIRLRVNYSLLDSEHIFIGFVLKQLESIAENQIKDAELLIPAIFEFLCLLSYENYHSKTIIDVPKILQLCESLSTAEHSSSMYAVAALQIVARDMFSTRTSTSNANELETQREVIISMLLKHVNHSTVLNSVANILNFLKLDQSNEEKARKLSRQILDVLLPKLSNHKVEIHEANDVLALIKLLKALSPGALRPCDAVITTLLSTGVDLANLREVQSWLGFTLASLIIIFQLSPEEAVLGRLQDLGIMLGSGGSSILDSSIDSSISSSSDPHRPPGSSPASTLVTFIFHCVGSAVHKLNQLTFSSSVQEEDNVKLLVWQIKELLLFVMYLQQSGNCPKIRQAACALAKTSPAGTMHNIDGITDLMLQLTTAYPTLVTQWLYILILLEKNSIPIWAQALNTSNRSVTNTRIGSGELAEESSTLNMEIVRRSSLALISNYLIENTHDGELLAWFLSSQIREIIQYHEEPQINELINVIHRQPASSRLLVQSISVRWDLLKTSKYSECSLKCLVNTHKSVSGHLIMLLANKFLTHPITAVAKQASKEVCRRLESLLQENEAFIHDQLPNTDVAQLVETLSTKKNALRFPRLMMLLNQLSVSFYELSPIELGESRKFHPGSVSSLDLDNTWFLQQVKKYCCTNNVAPKECARLLSYLGFGDIMLVLTAKDFNLKILEECLSQGILLPDGRAPSIDSLDRLPGLLSDPDRSPGLREVCYPMKEGPPLYRCGSQVLLQHIRNLVELLPRPPQVYHSQNYWDPSPAESRYTHKLNEMFSRAETRNLFVILFPAYSRLLLTYPQLPGRRPTLPPHSLLEMARFGILALELIKWLNFGRREDVRGKENIIDICLQAAALTLLNPHLGAALSLPAHNALVSSAAIAVTDHVRAILPHLHLPTLSYNNLNERLVEKHPPPTLVAGSCLAKLLIAFERSGLRDEVPVNLFSTVIGLSRLQQFSSLCRAPPICFQLGWDPEIVLQSQVLELPSIPVKLMQEKEVLSELVWRINMLGWSSRPQYEETWMSLLSVLNVSHDDLTNDEINAVSQSTALVVNALTSQLVATLGLPVAGVPGTQLLHHPRDSPHSFLLSGRGQQLTAIQNIIHQRLDSSDIRIGLPVDSSVNLERSFPHIAMDCKTSYSPLPRTRYGPGQVSLNYISTCLAYHEEGGSDDRQSLASSALPLYLLIREENLAAAGLDTISCIHFIIDLYSQWLAHGGQDTPLAMLHSTVHSILMVSDIFTQTNQFSWMLSTFNDLQKVHPIEDEVISALLCQGICKALSVLGVGLNDTDMMDRVKKSLETNLKSPHLLARTSALHGALYLLQSSESLGENLQPVLSILIEHIKQNLLVGGGKLSTEHSVHQYNLLLWTSLFYLLENFSQAELAEPDLETNLQQLSFATISSPDLPKPLYTCILAGLERLVVAGKIRGRYLDQLVKISTDLMTEWAPVSVIPAVQLFLAAMYASHPPAAEQGAHLPPVTITDPELLMQMMEQMSILFDCVRRAAPQEAELLSEILPQVLIDFFPASDVVNRVISEFISPGQPHPTLLAAVLRQIFKAAVEQDQQGMLTEWVLMSLPNFTRRSPLSHSIWCLTCFFIAASVNPCLQAMFPHLLYLGTRSSLQESIVSCEEKRSSLNHDERRLFCLAAVDFYSYLTDDKLKKKFRETFESVSEVGNPYADLLAAIEHKDEQD